MLNIIKQAGQNNDFLHLIRLLSYANYQSLVDDEPLKVKFLSSLAAVFPKTEVEEIKVTDNYQIEIVTNFLTIVGGMGVMPSHYTEYILARSREKDFSFLNFINIFYDKLIKLFIKITTNNIYLEYEKYILTRKSEVSSNWIFIKNIIGVNQSIVEQNLPTALLKYAGLLVNLSRPVDVLKFILEDYLQLPIQIEQFIKEKQKLKQSELSRLGRTNNNLSESLYLGKYAYFYQNKIIIRIPKLNFQTYDKFLTDHTTQKSLREILNFYLGSNVKYQLIFLVAEQEKMTLLSSSKPRKLGINIWCKA